MTVKIYFTSVKWGLMHGQGDCFFLSLQGLSSKDADYLTRDSGHHCQYVYRHPKVR